MGGRRGWRTTTTAVLAVGIALTACSSTDGIDAEPSTSTQPPASTPATSASAPATQPATTPAATAAPTSATPTTAPPTTSPEPAASPIDVRAVVAALAADELRGRVRTEPDAYEQTLAYLVEQLAGFAAPMFTDQVGDGGYLQQVDSVNVLGVIAGSDLADEWVVVGAHYDHLGTDCRPGPDPSDTICNGATDNATGVAAALAIGQALAQAGPRRSVLIALWDQEEVALNGSADFIADPTVPLGQIVGYLNLDIQGSNLLPSLRATTVVVGAETGGQALIDMVARANDASTLDELMLSLLFGQGRSDHANFADAGIPTVFYTDANNGCYHTVDDELEIVDFDKLDQQIAGASALAREWASTDTAPTFSAAPAAVYADAVSMLAVVERGIADMELLPALADMIGPYQVQLAAIVEAGPTAFDDQDVGVMLAGAATIVSGLAEAECDGHLSA